MGPWWPLGGAAFLSSFTSTDEGEAPFYDFNYTYVKMSPECTDMIDELLADKRFGLIRHKEMRSGNRVKPNLGTHYYYLNVPQRRSRVPYKYIYLIKKKGTANNRNGQNQSGNNQENHYYVSCYGKFSSDVHERFLKRLFATDEMYVRGIHIDSSEMKHKFILSKQLAGVCKPRQQQAIDLIREHFLAEDGFFNTKVIISGKRGVGKTYTAGLLKKAIESSFSGYANKSFVQLFFDFNPTIPGLDIISNVLIKATKDSPIILVMNEIDACYEAVFKNTLHHDPRPAATDNRTSFHTMLDAIPNYPNVITIFTTEKSKEELDAVNITSENTDNQFNYLSFYRKGRVDFFIHMTDDDEGIEGSSTRVDTVVG